MFVCIENNRAISFVDYEPEVPSSVEVVEISRDDYEKIVKKTHFFNASTKSVEQQPVEVLNSIEQEKINLKNEAFLNSTDWKILRHLREMALGVQTSMTQEEYLKLESERQAAADSIVK